jgi:hypothetical protein
MSFTPLGFAKVSPPRNKGGRPKDSFVDELLEVADNGMKLSRSPQRCRFCDKTYATRNCGRAKKHAAFVCPHIPLKLQEKARDELSRKKPPKKERRIVPPPQQPQVYRYNGAAAAGNPQFWSRPNAFEFERGYWEEEEPADKPPVGLPGPLGPKRYSDSPEPPTRSPCYERSDHEIKAEAAAIEAVNRVLPPIRILDNPDTKILAAEIADLNHPIIVSMADKMKTDLDSDSDVGSPENGQSVPKKSAPISNSPGPPDASDEKASEDERKLVLDMLRRVLPPGALLDPKPEGVGRAMTTETKTPDRERTSFPISRPEHDPNTIDIDES